MDKLFQLWCDLQVLPETALNILVDFHYCQFLNHLGVAFLGGLAHLVKARGGHFTFKWDSLPDKIYTNLAQNGFLYEFGCNQHPWDGNSIPYRSDRQHDETAIVDYLRYKWLGRGWLNISPGLQESITGQVLEIYLNAFEHSQSSIGVFSCGQHYPQAKMLNLTVIDFGIGIPSNVRSLAENAPFSSAEALAWAFQSGNTTKLSGVSRGMGLSLLQSFVTENRGNLRIFSNDGCISIDDNGVRPENKRINFTGTLVNIALRCDESYYCLASEASSAVEPWF